MPATIWNSTDDQLSQAQAKITYLGEQTKLVPTVAFAVEGHKVAMVRFLSVQRSRRPYTNDESPYTKTFAVSRDEFKRMLSGVQPIVKSAAEGGQDFLSFSVVTGAGAALVGEECLIPRSQGKQFYAALLQSLSPANIEGQTIVRAQLKNVYPE